MKKMKKMNKLFVVLLFLFILFISTAIYAVETETYAVENIDGSVRILYYIPSSHDSLTEFLESVGASNLPLVAIKQDKLPSRIDREFWVLADGKVVVDRLKKKKVMEERARKLEEAILT